MVKNDTAPNSDFLAWTGHQVVGIIDITVMQHYKSSVVPGHHSHMTHCSQLMEIYMFGVGMRVGN